MTIRTRKQAVDAANATHKNVVNTCQKVTREWFGAPSAGDRDKDGDADAIDGWLSETKKHSGDRKPPAGVPVAYGGSKNGHRAISVGLVNNVHMIRSTDAGGRGVTATVPLDWPEKHWGLKYLGWSETIDGYPIPNPELTHAPSKPKPKPKTRGQNADKALQYAKRMVWDDKDTKRKAKVQKAVKALQDIDYID